MIETKLHEMLAARPVIAPGHVWLVGAGPGDPGQLTIDALSALRQADVVIHDALVDDRVLALARPEARLVPSGKRGGQPSVPQTRTIEQMKQFARAGMRVIRLKGGDPFVFGRGGEEVLALAMEGIPFRVLPGLTAGIAALAAATIPITLRSVNQAVVIATGHAAEGNGSPDWRAIAKLGQPIVLYMAMARIGSIAEELIAGGLPPTTPAAVIASATTPDERILVTELGMLAATCEERKFKAPAIVAIGDIVSIRQQIADMLPVAAQRLG